MMAGRVPFLQGWKYRVIAIVLFSLLSAATLASAQNTFPASGNVGIGTTTPAHRLDVVIGERTEASSNRGGAFLDLVGRHVGVSTNQHLPCDR